jgi:hypothetical protein
MRVAQPFLLTVVALAALAFIGCGGGEPSPVQEAEAPPSKPAPPPTEPAKVPDTKSLIADAKVPVEDEAVWARREKKWAEEQKKIDAEKKRKAEEAKWREEVFPEAQKLANNCRKLDNTDTLWLRDKVMIWDAELNVPSTALPRLPSEVRAQLTDRDVTLLFIIKTETPIIGQYRERESGALTGFGFAAEMDVVILDMPTKHTFGMLHLSARNLPVVRLLKQARHEVLDKGQLLVSLVQGLPSKAQWEEWNRQKTMAARVSTLVEQCKALAPNAAMAVQKKALIFHADGNTRSSVNDYLSKELRGDSSDSAITFFFITDVTRQHIGYYIPQGDQWVLRDTAPVGPEGYRLIWDVAVVDGARNQAIGRVKVEGDVPPLTVPKSVGMFPMGDPDKQLAAWVARLQR